MNNKIEYEAWPELSAEAFNISSHLLFMGIQVVGKLMLHQPFQAHWSHLAMPLNSRGISTGIIPFNQGSFSVDFDFIDHVILVSSSWGKTGKIKLHSMSVSELTQTIMETLNKIGVDIKINLTPQEISNPINFDQDTAPRIYDEKTVNAWWRIMLSTYHVLLQHHSHFCGISPPIGLFWGTLDLRDARYKGLHLPPVQAMSGYIARNSMDDAQVEVGFSCSNEKYPYPSFFAFAYPCPKGLELEKMKPEGVKWVPSINEFILDYDQLRKSKNPEADLLLFFESYYQAVAKLDHWDPKFCVSGVPI